MRNSAIVPDDAQKHFWDVVRECIREFHASRVVASLGRLKKLRQNLDQKPIEEFELFFHLEPFDVACSLADQQLKVEDYLTRYLEIRDDDNVLSP